MKFTMLPRVLAQMLKKPFTNPFPRKYIPSSTTHYLADIQQKKTTMTPPVATPDRFRGKIQYDREKCTGCQLCLKVCPSETIVFKTGEKKIKIYLARCTFCSQCNDICPVNCLSMGHEILLAGTDKYSKDLIVE